MVIPVALIHLPADLAITERSRKFYDGTYKWDSDGFTDEHGGKYEPPLSETRSDFLIVYRKFDWLDPLARAPTPLPPISSDDEDGRQADIATVEPMQPFESGSTVMSADRMALEPASLCPRPNGTAATTPDPRTPEDTRRFAIDFLLNSKQSKKASQDQLDISSPGNNTIYSKLEGSVNASERVDTEADLHTGYELREATSAAKEKSGNVRMPDTPPESPAKTASGVQTTSPTSTVSTLSPVPSNLSDQDKDVGIKVDTATC